MIFKIARVGIFKFFVQAAWLRLILKFPEYASNEQILDQQGRWNIFFSAAGFELETSRSRANNTDHLTTTAARIS